MCDNLVVVSLESCSGVGGGGGGRGLGPNLNEMGFLVVPRISLVSQSINYYYYYYYYLMLFIIVISSL